MKTDKRLYCDLSSCPGVKIEGLFRSIMAGFKQVAWLTIAVLLLLIFNALLSHAQMPNDTTVPNRGSRYVIFGENLTWGATVPVGTNGNWLVNVPGTNLYGCLQVSNKTTGFNTANYQAWGTMTNSGPLAGGLVNSQRWKLLADLGASTFPNTGGLASVPANSTAFGVFRAHGMNRIAIAINRTVGTDGPAMIGVSFNESPFCGDASFATAPGGGQLPFDIQGKMAVVGTVNATQSITEANEKPVLIGGLGNGLAVGFYGVGQDNNFTNGKGYPIGGIRSTGTFGHYENVNTTARATVAAAATTEIIAATGGQNIRVTSAMLAISANGSFTVVRGTGVNCGTGTATVFGPFGINAGAPFVLSGGINPIWFIPTGEALCITATTGNIEGLLAYSKH